MGFSFNGQFNSPLLSIPPRGVNGSGHGIQGCVVAPTNPDDPSKNWTR